MITVDGVAQTVSFAQTASGAVGTATVTVRLNAGTNTIEFAGSGSGSSPSLDHIEV